MEIKLLGEPRSTQHCYKYHCRSGFPKGYMSEECRTLKEDYEWQARSQYHGKPLQMPLRVELHLFLPRRRGDIDNFCKLIFDALTGCVWDDDKQIEELFIRKDVDKETPRAELSVTEIPH